MTHSAQSVTEKLDARKVKTA